MSTGAKRPLVPVARNMLVARKGALQVGKRYTVQYRLPGQTADRWGCLDYVGVEDEHPVFVGPPLVERLPLKWDWIKDYGPSSGGYALNRKVTW